DVLRPRAPVLHEPGCLRLSRRASPHVDEQGGLPGAYAPAPAGRGSRSGRGAGMKALARSEAVRIIALLVILIGAKTALLGYGDRVKPLPWPTGQLRSWGEKLVETISSRSLNREAREALTAGYYEGLMNEGSRLSAMNRLVTDNRPATFE